MEFKQAVVTQNGRALMAKLLAGKSTQFTKIKVSSTIYPDAQLANLTALTNIKQETSAQAYENNTATVSVVGAIENTGLTTGYYINTVGLYAVDPDKGEILYSVSSASVNGYMPPDTGVSKSGFEFKIYTEVGNASKVDLTVDPAAFATHEDVERVRIDLQKTKDEFIRFLCGESINRKHKVDFRKKVLGSTIENPHIMLHGAHPALPHPSTTTSELQNMYDNVLDLDEKIAIYQNRTSGNIARQLFKWNLIEQVVRDYPGLFESVEADTLDKQVTFLKQHITGLNLSIWGYGSGPTGNKLSFVPWSNDAWITSSSHSNNTGIVQELMHKWENKNTISNIIQSDGFLYMLAYAEISDGITASLVSIDYASLEYTLSLKKSDFYVPRSEYNQEIGEIKTWIQAHS